MLEKLTKFIKKHTSSSHWLGNAGEDVNWNLMEHYLHVHIHQQKFIYVFFQKNIHTLSYNNTQVFVLPLSNSENHEYMKDFWNIYCFVTIHNRDQNIQNQKLITVVICRLVHLLPDWLFPFNTMTLQKYFWSSCSLAPKKSQLGQNWTLPWPVRGACREHPLTHCFRDFEQKMMQERTPWD